MSQNDWDDEFKDREPQPNAPRPSPDPWADDREQQPKKTGMSSGMKALLILGAIGGACFLLCCGGIALFVYSMVPKMSRDPAAINAARDNIAKIDLPKGFEPVQMFKTDNFFVTMQAVVYENRAVNGRIMLATANLKVGDPAQRNQVQITEQMEQQGFGRREVLQNAKMETKKLKIRGKEYPFEFAEGDDPTTHKKRWQISGLFEGARGPTLILIQIDESAYKEQEIVKMLEGIQ